MNHEGDLLEAWDAPPRTPAGPDLRPVIRLRAGELPALVAETIAALGQDQNLYQRAGQLVRIVREPTRTEGACPGRVEGEDCGTCHAGPQEPCSGPDRRVRGDVLTRPGTPRLRAAGPVLAERAAVVARWERWKAQKPKKGQEGPCGEWVPADPEQRVLSIVAHREDWPGIRPIKGVLETPALAPSGRILSRPGYDPETCYVVVPNCEVPPIPENLSREDCRDALRELWITMACDFPFAGLGEPDPADTRRELQFIKALQVPDAFVGIAALLSILARPAIDGPVPAFAFEAPGQGSGKSLQTHTIAMVATGRPAGVAAFPVKDGRPNEEELDKVLGGYALAQSRLVAFDNVRGVLGGAALEGAITAPGEKEFRILGVNEQRAMPWIAVLMFTGNNLSMNDDFAQRVILSRIESPREDPRSRPPQSFLYPRLLPAVKARRARLIWCALVVVKGYLDARAAGLVPPSPDTGTLGSFDAWSELIPPAIAWAGGPNVLHARPALGHGEDDESTALEAVLRGWPEAWNGSTAGQVKALAFTAEKAREKGEGPDDGLDDMRSALRGLVEVPYPRDVSSLKLGNVLAKYKGKIRGGYRLVVVTDSHRKQNVFRVERAAAGGVPAHAASGEMAAPGA